VNLSPLTTGTTTLTDPAGLFCPDQANPGAFGRFSARTITETGVPLGASPVPSRPRSPASSAYRRPAARWWMRSRTCPVPPRWAFPGWRRSSCS